MSSRVICIARVKGGGGEGVGQAVADALGFQLADEEIIQQAAEAEGVAVEELAEVERRNSTISRLMRSLALSGAAEGALSGVYSPIPDVPTHDPKSLRALIQKSIHETAERGSVVIISHAASFALADRADTLRVLITAPTEVRVRRTVATDGLDAKHAAKAIHEDDAGRATYLRKFYGVEMEMLGHYDLLINTEKLSPEAIAAVVISAAQGS